ncbi:hypothetical protein C0J52_26180, partial [Blattella germanica]
NFLLVQKEINWAPFNITRRCGACATIVPTEPTKIYTPSQQRTFNVTTNCMESSLQALCLRFKPYGLQLLQALGPATEHNSALIFRTSWKTIMTILQPVVENWKWELTAAGFGDNALQQTNFMFFCIIKKAQLFIVKPFQEKKGNKTCGRWRVLYLPISICIPVRTWTRSRRKIRKKDCYNNRNWSMQIKIAPVEAFLQTGSVITSQRALRRNNQDRHEPVPERHSIMRNSYIGSTSGWTVLHLINPSVDLEQRNMDILEKLNTPLEMRLENIPREMLQNVITYTRRRADLCLRDNGGHLSDFIFKT